MKKEEGKKMNLRNKKKSSNVGKKNKIRIFLCCASSRNLKKFLLNYITNKRKEKNEDEVESESDEEIEKIKPQKKKKKKTSVLDLINE